MSCDAALLSVDVGLHGLGCGWYRGRSLEVGWYAPRPEGLAARGPEAWRGIVLELEPLGLDPDEVAVETMQVYDRAHSRKVVDPDDLFQLEGIVGALGMYYRQARVTGYLPRVWKGGVPQGVMARRIAAVVAERGWTERVLLPGRVAGKDRDHDVWHGVGIGLHHLGYMRGGLTVVARGTGA